MDPYTQDRDGHGFAIGLLAGTVVGAGLMTMFLMLLPHRVQRVVGT